MYTTDEILRPAFFRLGYCPKDCDAMTSVRLHLRLDEVNLISSSLRRGVRESRDGSATVSTFSLEKPSKNGCDYFCVVTCA